MAPLALGAACIITGGFLLFQRANTHGVRFWPMMLVIVGLIRMGWAPAEERDEAFMLFSTGCWLLMTTIVPNVIRNAGPVMMVGAGLLAFRWALNSLPASREGSHVN
jgi:hypothetical protein